MIARAGALALALVMSAGCARQHARGRATGASDPDREVLRHARCVSHWISSGSFEGVPEVYVNAAQGPRDPEPLFPEDRWLGSRGFAVQAVPDVTGDGVPDLVVQDYYPGAALLCEPVSFTLLSPDARGPGAWPRESVVSEPCVYGMPGVVPFRDFDGDGLTDLLVRDRVFLRDAEQGWIEAEERCENGGEIGDADGDGLADSACDAGEDAEDALSIVWGGGGERARVVLSAPDGVGDGRVASIEAAGDLDGDGFADFVVRHARQRHRVVMGAARAELGARQFATGGDARARFVIAPGDVDGDGFADLLTSGPDGAQLVRGARTLRLDGGTDWSLPTAVEDRIWPAGDANCDGYADVLAQRRMAGLELYLGSAAGLSERPAWSSAAHRLVPVLSSW